MAVPAPSTQVRTSTTRFFERPEGRIAYDDQGSGPLVLLVPSLGDVRSEYRFLVPQLVTAGYRVVSMDLRGLGASSTGWSSYTNAALGSDVVALVRHLGGGPAVLVGCSMGGGAVAWAAAEASTLVSRLVLIDPFVHSQPAAMPLQNTVFWLMFARPWGPSVWGSYYTSLYPTRPPADLTAYTAALVANLREPGRIEANRAMMLAPKTDVEQRLGQVQAPTLVVMGSKDPDFSKVGPEKEARELAQLLNGRSVMIADAGHYPHTELPELTGPAIVSFLAEGGGR
jgi:pimeloyl-ACP methyl ester carboxylesterase